MAIDSDSENKTIKKSQTLHSLTTGPLSSSISNLSSSSKALPSNEDFHFYYNFNEFKSPIKQIVTKTDSTLKSIASSSFWDKKLNFPDKLDHLDEAYDWLVNMNDEIFERFDLCVDEFSKVRKLEEESGVRVLESMEEDGFQVVCGKKKKKREVRVLEKEEVKAVVKDGRTTTKTGVKPRVPFHIPSITRPQREFQVVVDNSNEPFQHVWLERSEDGERVVHPLESFSEFDFIDRDVKDAELIKPLPIERTPFKLIEEVKDLKELAAKLRDVNEFAADLMGGYVAHFDKMGQVMGPGTKSIVVGCPISIDVSWIHDHHPIGLEKLYLGLKYAGHGLNLPSLLVGPRLEWTRLEGALATNQQKMKRACSFGPHPDRS